MGGTKCLLGRGQIFEKWKAKKDASDILAAKIN